MNIPSRRSCARALIALLAGLLPAAYASASDFSEPWLREDRALVLDAYEYNELDWQALSTDKRIVGFINKASDGLPPDYRCRGEETERRLCSALWKRYSVARELYHTRRTIAKALGMEWGAYHLGRPGNPVEQADHFIRFARPEPDDLVAIDIEDNDPEKWMSLEDAEIFARRIKSRLGRYPILYTNGNTAKHIADNRHAYPLLSRLPLWYARYKPQIGDHFPNGHWDSYALWQFSSLNNCDARRCPYRVPGTPHNIDVNVAAMDGDALRAAWPFGEMIEGGEELVAAAPAEAATLAARDKSDALGLLRTVPLPVARKTALEGEPRIAYVPVKTDPAQVAVASAYAPVKPAKAMSAFAALLSGKPTLAAPLQPSQRPPQGPFVGLAEYLAWLKDKAREDADGRRAEFTSDPAM